MGVGAVELPSSIQDEVGNQLQSNQARRTHRVGHLHVGSGFDYGDAPGTVHFAARWPMAVRGTPSIRNALASDLDRQRPTPTRTLPDGGQRRRGHRCQTCFPVGLLVDESASIDQESGCRRRLPTIRCTMSTLGSTGTQDGRFESQRAIPLRYCRNEPHADLPGCGDDHQPADQRAGVGRSTVRRYARFRLSESPLRPVRSATRPAAKSKTFAC